MKKLFLLLSLVLMVPMMWAQRVGTQDRMIALTQDGETTLLAPNGVDKSYFWTSLSPDGTKILYVTFQGTFVCDLDGGNVRALGWLNAPVWANNEWIVGMQNTDDGERITSSKLVARSLDGAETKTIATDDAIAMYPKVQATANGAFAVSYENAKGTTCTTSIALPNVTIGAKNLVPAKYINTVKPQPRRKAATSGSLAGLKIYVNPGHGGYDANDRSCWTIPVPEKWSNPAGYWESKSNLVKGLALRDMLEAAGATVYMSRTENTSGERDLDYYYYATEEEREAMMNGGDRDLTKIAEEANANAVDQFISLHSNALNGKTNYLLVLYHGLTGKPKVAESDKMATSVGALLIQNTLTCWNASKEKIYGDRSYYGETEDDPLGGLGVLRPLTVPGFSLEGSFHDYAPETHRLMNEDYCKIEALRVYQYLHKYYERALPQTGTIAGWVKSGNELVDVLNEPNFYYYEATNDQYLPLNGAEVHLLDASGAVLQTKFTDEWYNGVFAFYDLEPGEYKLAVRKNKYAIDTVSVTVAAEEIAQVKIFARNIRLHFEDYPQPEQVDGTIAPTAFEFEAAGDKVACPASNIVRALHRDGQLIILTSDNTLGVYSSAGVKEADVAIPVGVTLRDIAFSADGYLCALATDGDKTTIWTWDNLSYQAREMFSQTIAGVGSTLAVSGARWEGKYYLTATKQLVGIQYNEDAPTEQTVKTLALDKDLTDAQLTIMPSGELYLDSKILPAIACTFDWDGSVVTTKELAANGYSANVITSGGTFFRYADHYFMAMPVADASGANVGFQVLDVTDGFDRAVVISNTYPATGLGTAVAPYMTAMASVIGNDVTIYVLAEAEGLQTFKTRSPIIANIYAGECSFSEEDNNFSFRLNEEATALTISIEKEGEIIGTYEVGALSKGLHNITNPFPTTEFDFFSITATGRSVSSPVKISNDDNQFQYYAPRGFAIDKTPSSPYFGRIYATNSVAGTDGYSEFTSRQTTGVFILNSDLTSATDQGATGYTGNVEWGTQYSGNYQFCFARPAVGPDGKVYLTNSTLDASGIYVMDPANPSSDFTPLFKGRRDASTGCVRKGSTPIHNMIMHAVLLGTGKETVLYTYDRNMSQGTVFSNILQYNIGELDSLPWNAAPTATVYDDALIAYFENGNGQIASDGRGGWWMSQYRGGAGSTVRPALVHITNGEQDYNCGSAIPTSYQGGMGVTADGNRLAIGTTTGNVDVYDVTYDDANVPTLELAYSINWGDGKGNTMCVDFDAAGNLYIISNSNERLMVYSLPKQNNSYTTRVPYAKTPVESVSLNQITLHLVPQETAQLTTIITPENASNTKIIWATSNPEVATVDNGLVTAVGVGSAVIIATTEDGGFTATCNVTVSVPVTGITLSETTLYMQPSDAKLLIVTIEPANATNQNYTLVSDNEDVVIVAADGWLIANAVGTATITATSEDGGYTATCKVIVDIPVTGITLSDTALVMQQGSAKQLSVTIQPADATNQNYTLVSDNENVVIVAADGWIIANAVGTATITATSENGGYTATCNVKVTSTTGVETVSMENGSTVQKIVENGTIYILRGGEKYSVDGRKVE